MVGKAARSAGLRAGAVAAAALLSATHPARAVQLGDAELADLTHLSIEELGDIMITSVSKRPETIDAAPAAIYVISRDDIDRSGATSLPEILRLAPNLHVAEVTASRHAISPRGFNGGTADKLLVLVDGRSIYTPFSSGVNWDLQEVPPETIERIEVISGPGGTLWGANAVNGVINVITRAARDTNGGVLELGGGNVDLRGSLQYGGALGAEADYRAYVVGFRRNSNNLTGTGAPARDDWHKVQGGFRVDWAPSDDLFTLQGDLYRGAEQQLATADESISGQNLLARWTHTMDDGATLQVQAYYDHIDVVIPNRVANHLDTYDIQAQHNFSWGERHQIVWGGGYRVMRDDFPTILSATQTVLFTPQSRTFGLGNVFIQDTIALDDSLNLIAGLKLEDEPYTGLEVMPNARLAWQVTPADLIWLSVSRAVRVPSRLDRDVEQYTGGVRTIAGGAMQPVEVLAYELGYRAQPFSDLSFSISGFYNDYPNLRSAEPTNGTFPLVFANGIEGETYGVEFWANYSVTDWWRVTLGANWLHKALRIKPGNFGVGGLQVQGNDPDYQVSLRSTMNLSRNVAFNLDLRRIGALPAPPSPSYTELGARIAWRPSENLELSVTGSNLLHAHHVEFGTTANTLQVGPVGVQAGRRVFANTRWMF